MATDHSLSLRTKRSREEVDISTAIANTFPRDLAEFVEEDTRPRKQARMALPSRPKPLITNNAENRKAKTDAAFKAVQRGLQRRLGDRYQDPESENTDAIPAIVNKASEVAVISLNNEQQDVVNRVDHGDALDARTQISEILLGDHAAGQTEMLSLPSTSLRRTSSAVYYCAFNRLWSAKPCEECALKDWGGPLEVIEEEPEDESRDRVGTEEENHKSFDSDNASTIILTGGHLDDDTETNSGNFRYDADENKENTQTDHSSDDESGLDEDFPGGAYLDEDALRDVEDYIEGSSSGDEEDQSDNSHSDDNAVGFYLQEDDAGDESDRASGQSKPRQTPFKHGDEVVSSSSDVSESEVYYDN